MDSLVRSLPPAGAEVVADGAGVIGKAGAGRERNLDAFEHRLNRLTFGSGLVGRGVEEVVVLQRPAGEQGDVLRVPAGVNRA